MLIIKISYLSGATNIQLIAFNGLGETTCYIHLCSNVKVMRDRQKCARTKVYVAKLMHSLPSDISFYYFLLLV